MHVKGPYRSRNLSSSKYMCTHSSKALFSYTYTIANSVICILYLHYFVSIYPECSCPCTRVPKRGRLFLFLLNCYFYGHRLISTYITRAEKYILTQIDAVLFFTMLNLQITHKGGHPKTRQHA